MGYAFKLTRLILTSIDNWHRPWGSDYGFFCNFRFCFNSHDVFSYEWIWTKPGRCVEWFLHDLDLYMTLIGNNRFFNFALIDITFHLLLDFTHAWTKQHLWPSRHVGWFRYDPDLCMILTDKVRCDVSIFNCHIFYLWIDLTHTCSKQNLWSNRHNGWFWYDLYNYDLGRLMDFPS